MAYMEWTRDLNIGIDVIDEQHRRIVDYINTLHDALEKDDQQAVAGVFEDLVDYTLTHFTFEESLLEEAGYTYISAHKRLHQLFVRKLDGYKVRYEDGDKEALAELSRMLKAWLVNHIRHDDADYVTMVRPVVESDSRQSWLSGRLKRLFGGRAG